MPRRHVAASLAGLLLVAAIAVWIAAPSRQASPPAVADDEQVGRADGAGGDQPPGADADSPDGELDSLQAPDDLDAAKRTARRFARAVYLDDTDTLRVLATRDHAARLVGPGATPSESISTDAEVSVDGVVTRDLRGDEVTLQVLLRRDTADGERVEAVELALQRTDGDWRVDDGAW